MVEFKYNDLITVGKAYDLTEKLLLVLDKNLIIKYMNSYAIKIFNLTDATIYIDKPLNLICKENGFPIFVDKNFKVLSTPITLGTNIKQLHLRPVLIEGNTCYFLFDVDITESETIHHLLESKLTQITGQTPLNRLSGQQSIDALCSCFENIIAQMPGYIYWKDQNYKYVFCNNAVASSLGFTDPKEIVGKTDYDFGWNKKIVDKYRKIDEEIIKTGKIKLDFEETVVEHNGHTLNLLVNKMPLFDQNKKVIGIIGVDVDITDRKEAEKLKIEYERQKAEIQAKEEFKGIIDEFNHILQKHKFSILYRNTGIENKLDKSDKENIMLNKREQEILYFISLNKSPKEIASILGVREQKTLAPATIQAIITKQLYVKFGVYSVSNLIEKASFLGLIPFSLEP